jgi:hypothetical protein
MVDAWVPADDTVETPTVPEGAPGRSEASAGKRKPLPINVIEATSTSEFGIHGGRARYVS